MQVNSYNVFLSGGGMKGAYQYGFFKELYRVYPDFPIKRVYAVSVGAINSVAIVTKKVSALDEFWCHPEKLPFDTIADDWDGSSNRVRSLIKHGSVFKKMKRAPYEDFLTGIHKDEFKSLQEKLVVISYDRANKVSLFSDCTLLSIDQIVDSIHASARFPGLFRIQGLDKVDGMFANADYILDTHVTEPWLCIDLQGTLKTPPSPNSVMFSPCISRIPIINQVTCILSHRIIIDHLIKNGRDDASAFVIKLMKSHIKVDHI